jgi:hypothetical protein
MQIFKYVAALTSVLTLATSVPLAASEEKPMLLKIQQTVAAKKYIDLAHTFEPGIRRWPRVPKRGAQNDLLVRQAA